MNRFPGHMDLLARTLTRSKGPWPFVTWRSSLRDGRRFIWRARDHRKGLAPADRGEDGLPPPLWRTRGYNQLIGLLFAIGGLLFAAGSALSLLPPAQLPASPVTVSIIFFMGSAPFTIAGYLQHFQSANAGSLTRTAEAGVPGRIALIGWRPDTPGWISTLAQFAGTIAFNFNTGDGIRAPAGWLAQDAEIWAPDFIGSVLFLISGYLAFIEYGHAYWSWKPHALSWRLVSVNLAGCVFFMISAILAWVPDGPEPGWIQWSSNLWLLSGSLAFLAGGLLTIQEASGASTGEGG